MVKAGTLAGVAEVARTLRVGRTTVTQWAARRHRNHFPEPVATLGMGPIYDLNEVIAWYGSYEPEKGGRVGQSPGQGRA
jgi:RNA-splicing ligase RtcB